MKISLYIRSGPETLSLHSRPDSYSSALSLGQSFGPGNFFIDSGDRVPCRALQLGENEPGNERYLPKSREEAVGTKIKRDKKAKKVQLTVNMVAED